MCMYVGMSILVERHAQLQQTDVALPLLRRGGAARIHLERHVRPVRRGGSGRGGSSIEAVGGGVDGAQSQGGMGEEEV